MSLDLGLGLGIFKRPGGGLPAPTADYDFSLPALPSGVINTRSTVASVTCCEGLVRTAKINEARFEGLRRVENLVPSSEFAPSAVAAGTTPPTINRFETYLGKNCLAVTFPSGVNDFTASRANESLGIIVAANRTIRTRFTIAASRPLASGEQIRVALTGTALLCPFAFNDTTQPLSTEWQVCASNPQGVGVAGVAEAFTINPTGTLTSPLTIYITERQCEDVSGQSNQNPSEYVSNGVIRRNLLAYSEQFDNAAWSKFRSSITANSTASPSGGVDADKFVEDATASNNHSLSRIVGNPVSSSGYYTYSIHAKKGERGNILIRITDDPAATNKSVLVNFNVDTGGIDGTLLTNSPDAPYYSMSDAGNGWYRCVVGLYLSTARRVDVTHYVYNASGAPSNPTYSGDGVSGLYIWGAQAELGPTASSYQKVTDASAIDFNNYHGAAVDGVKYFSTANGNTVVNGVVVPGSGVALTTGKRLLREGQRTNLLINNVSLSSLTAAASTKQSITKTAPSGDATVVSVREDTTTTIHSLYSASTGTAGTYTVSARAAIVSGSRNLALTVVIGSAGQCAVFNLSTGEYVGVVVAGGGGGITVVGTPRIEAAEQGFWKLQMTVTIPSTAQCAFELVDGTTRTYAGNGTSEIAIWGVQFESGAYASSPILTAGVALARAIDSTYGDVPAAYNQSAGTWLVEYDVNGYDAAANQNAFAVSVAGVYTSDSLIIREVASGVQFYLKAATVVQLDTTLSRAVVAGARVTASIAYATNDTRVAGSGLTPSTDTACAMATALSRINFGSSADGLDQVFGHIRRVKYWDTRLSDANQDRAVA